mmetsp:Transcript_84708/g.244882  ORF Transcript_84708/g.244882 Transcript_84708/m.244882 type:complete len:258 (+) Transcript_84708:137-910(+)
MFGNSWPTVRGWDSAHNLRRARHKHRNLGARCVTRKAPAPPTRAMSWDMEKNEFQCHADPARKGRALCTALGLGTSCASFAISGHPARCTIRHLCCICTSLEWAATTPRSHATIVGVASPHRLADHDGAGAGAGVAFRRHRLPVHDALALGAPSVGDHEGNGEDELRRRAEDGEAEPPTETDFELRRQPFRRRLGHLRCDAAAAGGQGRHGRGHSNRREERARGAGAHPSRRGAATTRPARARNHRRRQHERPSHHP